MTILAQFLCKKSINVVWQPYSDKTGNCFICAIKFTVRPAAVCQHHQKEKCVVVVNIIVIIIRLYMAN